MQKVYQVGQREDARRLSLPDFSCQEDAYLGQHSQRGAFCVQVHSGAVRTASGLERWREGISSFPFTTVDLPEGWEGPPYLGKGCQFENARCILRCDTTFKIMPEADFSCALYSLH